MIEDATSHANDAANHAAAALDEANGPYEMAVAKALLSLSQAVSNISAISRPKSRTARIEEFLSRRGAATWVTGGSSFGRRSRLLTPQVST